jgi:regulatory protein
MRRQERPAPAPGQITGLRFQKRNPERVNVYIDGAFAMGLPALEAARLKVGQHLSAEDIERLVELDGQERAYDRVLNFLSYRQRSVAEVRRYLRQKEVEPTCGEAIIERLCRQGLLDDETFARWWVDNRSEFSPRGSFAIRQELRAKGVTDAVIGAVLATSGVGEEDALGVLARKRAVRLANEDGPSFRRKLTAFLVRRGFSFDQVLPLVETLWRETEQDAGASDNDLAGPDDLAGVE